VIATFSVGYDHVDIEAAKARGIAVCNTPDVLSLAAAELAILLILAAARRAGEGERMVRAGKWEGWAPTQLLGTQVSGRRLGIFGMGRIGREVARMARAFEMELHYRDIAAPATRARAGGAFSRLRRDFSSRVRGAVAERTGRRWHVALAQRGPDRQSAARRERGTLIDDGALIAA
jgi:lactate dehydrogenase-like 2-hydroxyacid dehydrogenase